jgi:signal transduction histidine kinase
VIVGADRATRLVEQLLRLARLDPLLSLPAPQPVDLAALAIAVAEDAADVAHRHSQTVTTILTDGPLTVSGDQDLLAAALRNLVDNAMRYTPEGGTIVIATRHEHGEPVVEVRDSGPGVAPAELPHLVERFYRGRDVTVEGSGLGLAIVRRIGELHGARLEVENLASGGFAARLRWCGNRPPGSI